MIGFAELKWGSEDMEKLEKQKLEYDTGRRNTEEADVLLRRVVTMDMLIMLAWLVLGLMFAGVASKMGVLMLLLASIYFAAPVGFEILYRRSVGMMIYGFRVRDGGGDEIGIGKMMIRSAVKNLVLVIPAAWIYLTMFDVFRTRIQEISICMLAGMCMSLAINFIGFVKVTDFKGRAFHDRLCGTWVGE